MRLRRVATAAVFGGGAAGLLIGTARVPAPHPRIARDPPAKPPRPTCAAAGRGGTVIGGEAPAGTCIRRLGVPAHPQSADGAFQAGDAVGELG